MFLNTDILYDALRSKHKVKRYGRGLKSQMLSLPAFYERGEALENGKVYIARTYDLPASSNTECLFICVGGSPSIVRGNWNGEVLHITDPGIDIITVFNIILSTYEKIIDWECKMQALIENNADIEELVKASIPIFENRITVVDYDLHVLAYCADIEESGQKKVRLSKRVDRVPDNKSARFEGIHLQSIKHREPYTYKEDGDDGDVSYCINLHMGDRFVGVCSLMEEHRPIRNSDYTLFQRFANYIQSALSVQSRALTSQFVSLKTIFTSLLQSLPVSHNDLNRALEVLNRTDEKRNAPPPTWICLVVKSANKGKTLPGGYLCSALEELLPECAAITHEEMIVAFCKLSSNISQSNIHEALLPYLKDMNFLAGISTPYNNFFKSRSYYDQATCALETGYSQTQKALIYKFEDYALEYMLMHCCGQLEMELIIPAGLMRLREYKKGNVDYWDTLKRYLDNESNASKTADEMFVHRGTLLPRLEKIKTFVDIDTPSKRLYLRMCMYMADILNGGE